MGATRKSHKKSRHGCLRCKKRKIKCDEVRPNCGYCSKKQLTCEYEVVSSSNINLIHSNGTTSMLPKPSVSPSQTGSDLPITHYSIASDYFIKMIRFIVNELCYLISSYEPGIEKFKKLIDFYCFKDSSEGYLDHICLALSAIYMHHSTNDSDSTYYYISRHHFSLFLNGFNQSLFNKDSKEFMSQTLAAVLLPSYCLLTGDLKFSNHVFYKTLKDGITSTWKHEQDPLKGIVKIDDERENILLLTKPVSKFDANVGYPTNLNKILNDDMAKCEQEHKTVYESLLKLLYNCYLNKSNAFTQGISPFISYWTIVLSDKFIELLEANDPRTILITIELVKFLLNNLASNSYNLVWKKILSKELEEDIQSLPQEWQNWYQEHIDTV